MPATSRDQAQSGLAHVRFEESHHGGGKGLQGDQRNAYDNRRNAPSCSQKRNHCWIPHELTDKAAQEVGGDCPGGCHSRTVRCHLVQSCGSRVVIPSTKGHLVLANLKVEEPLTQANDQNTDRRACWRTHEQRENEGMYHDRDAVVRTIACRSTNEATE